VFFVGRCVREKGIQVLLEAMHDVLAECPDAKLTISGKGPMLDELRSASSSLRLGNKVLFTGYVDDYTRNALMKSAALAVFPSLYEPFGIVALEAMAAGVPVVVSDTGGLAEIVDHGVDGLKALPGDRNSLSLQIRESLKYPDKSRSLAEKARNKVRSVYSWGAIACRTKDLYHNMKSR
jgi:1,4-alpha-glucan branching enzyme